MVDRLTRHSNALRPFIPLSVTSSRTAILLSLLHSTIVYPGWKNGKNMRLKTAPRAGD